MNLAISYTRSAVGIHAQPVSVEVHLSNGLPSFTMVGLPETAVKESKDRVRSAIINSQFDFPCRRITVNLAPANVPKTGSGFDLAIAIGILAAAGQIPAEKLKKYEFIGELALSGTLRGVQGILPAVLALSKQGKHLIIAKANAEEAALSEYPNIFVADNLREVCAHLCNKRSLDCIHTPQTKTIYPQDIDWGDVKGQDHAKRALEIAACGGHSVLLSGAPGSGKTMLAKRFHTLLPPLDKEKALECAAIVSISGRSIDYSQWLKPPFRSPHHTATSAALVGGGNPPKPGEISLAHHGVLFLDELPEFNRNVLESLREPIESGHICISRSATQREYPAKFQLIAAMNPCPCGHLTNSNRECQCSAAQIQKYLNKISDPLLDRIDIQVSIQPLKNEELFAKYSSSEQQSPKLRQQTSEVQEKQIARQNCLNYALNPRQSDIYCKLGSEENNLARQIMDKLKLSGRSWHRLLKVARTLADIEGREDINRADLQMALSFRQTIYKKALHM